MATQQAKNFVSLLSVKMTQCNLFVVREGCNLVILAGSHLGAFFASFRFRSDYAFANRIREVLSPDFVGDFLVAEDFYEHEVVPDGQLLDGLDFSIHFSDRRYRLKKRRLG